MTLDEYITKLHEVVSTEMEEINKTSEEKGFISSFDQGRSFELGVIEGSMVKIRKEAENEKV